MSNPGLCDTSLYVLYAFSLTKDFHVKATDMELGFGKKPFKLTWRTRQAQVPSPCCTHKFAIQIGYAKTLLHSQVHHSIRYQT